MSGDDQTRQFPRLAISDLLVLTLSVGLALACVAPSIRDLISSSENAPWAAITSVVIDYIGIGIGLFGLIVLARERIRGHSLPWSPGHWVLVATAPLGVMSLVINAVQPL